MHENPKVSVVMSVYNGERYLREAVDSILNQTFTDFEFVIVDDASTDSTPDILENHDDPRIVRLSLDKNQGIAGALNEGLRLSRGGYVARQDADDISLPDRLARQTAYLDARPEVGVLGCSSTTIDENGKPIRVSKKPLTNEEIQAAMPNAISLIHGSVMYRRSCIEQVGHYRPFFRRAQDRDLWLRMARLCEFHNLPEPLYQWRFIPSSYTVGKVIQQGRYSRLATEANMQPAIYYNEALLRAWGEPQLAPRFLTSSYWHGHGCIAEHCRRWAGFTFSQKLYRQALQLYAAALFFDPFSRPTWNSLIFQLLGYKTARQVQGLYWKLCRKSQ